VRARSVGCACLMCGVIEAWVGGWVLAPQSGGGVVYVLFPAGGDHASRYYCAGDGPNRK
jgi:hypothetical protein